MAKKSRYDGRAPKAGGGVTAVAGGKTSSGGESWHVNKEGRHTKIVTSGTSTAAMDDAMAIYSGALKRLAKR